MEHPEDRQDLKALCARGLKTGRPREPVIPAPGTQIIHEA
jgi:hypothetical protein